MKIAESHQQQESHKVSNVLPLQQATRNQIAALPDSSETGKKKIKDAFPLFGNGVFNVNGSFIDIDRVEALKAEDPALYELLMSKRADICAMLGINSLSELKNQYGNVELASKIRANVVDSLREYFTADAEKHLLDPSLLESIGPEVRQELQKRVYAELNKVTERELERLAKEADTLITGAVEKFFPETGTNPIISLVNEVENNHDIAKLVLMTADEANHSPRARFEALRKMAIMEVLIKLDRFENERAHEHRGLSYFDDIMNEGKMYSSKEGKQIGSIEVRYLISDHEPGSNSCVNAYLLEDAKKARRVEAMDINRHSTPIALRTFSVEDEDGNETEIKGMVDSRIKNRLSMALKLLRKNSMDAVEILKDLNGIRMLFEDERGIELFERTFLKKLRANGHTVEITRSKGTVGNGGLTFKKHNIEIDGRRYEWQIFTLNEFANYVYQRPNSWPEYEIKRFFESSSSEALFPSTIYGDLDRMEMSKHAQERAYHMASTRTWGTPSEDAVA